MKNLWKPCNAQGNQRCTSRRITFSKETRKRDKDIHYCQAQHEKVVDSTFTNSLNNTQNTIQNHAPGIHLTFIKVGKHRGAQAWVWNIYEGQGQGVGVASFKDVKGSGKFRERGS